QHFHIDVRQRFLQGDPEVLQAMQKFANLTDQARAAIQAEDCDRLAALLNENFDTRRALYRQLPQMQVEMVELARSTGASAKFAGSGGAIIGTYRDEAMYNQLQMKLAAIGCHVCRPKIISAR